MSIFVRFRMIGKGEKVAKARGGKRSGYDQQRRVGVSGAAGFVCTHPANFVPKLLPTPQPARLSSTQSLFMSFLI